MQVMSDSTGRRIQPIRDLFGSGRLVLNNAQDA